MTDLDAHYRKTLAGEFLRRKQAKPRYSQNAFARLIRVDSTYLSKLLAGKILLSLDVADRIAKKLKLPPDDRKCFLVSALEEQKCHALYLLDPALTDCDSSRDETNRQPRSRKTDRKTSP